MTRRWIVALVGASLALTLTSVVPAQSAYDWTLPPGYPPPAVPADNPMSAAKVELGRYLFYDTRLSGNGRQSCSSCHEQGRAFTDGRARSRGSTGELHPRSSMTLVNVAYAQVMNWANPAITRLEDQALIPMYSDRPIELGLDRSDRWLGTFEHDDAYRQLFRAAFPGEPAPLTTGNVVKAIAAFERAIVSARSPYDRYHFDRDDGAISDAAKRGEVLFHSRPLSCFTCHAGIHFSRAMGSSPRGMAMEFHNTGLYNLAGPLSYPADNTGIYESTRESSDVGKFKAPSLRNIAVTAPYMHDGSVATLAEVIDHYASGGRTIADGPYTGIGRENPNKSASIRGFSMTPDQRNDLLAFLESLTDESLLSDPRFANPHQARSRR